MEANQDFFFTPLKRWTLWGKIMFWLQDYVSTAVPNRKSCTNTFHWWTFLLGYLRLQEIVTHSSETLWLLHSERRETVMRVLRKQKIPEHLREECLWETKFKSSRQEAQFLHTVEEHFQIYFYYFPCTESVVLLLSLVSERNLTTARNHHLFESNKEQQKCTFELPSQLFAASCKLSVSM